MSVWMGSPAQSEDELKSKQRYTSRLQDIINDAEGWKKPKPPRQAVEIAIITAGFSIEPEAVGIKPGFRPEDLRKEG